MISTSSSISLKNKSLINLKLETFENIFSILKINPIIHESIIEMLIDDFKFTIAQSNEIMNLSYTVMQHVAYKIQKNTLNKNCKQSN